MKVSGGLIGITLNPSARTKYFLIAPELARLAEEAKLMAGTSSKTQTSHHNLTTVVRLREERNVQQLTASIQRFTNPFTVEGPDLFNLVTKVRMPEKVKKDLCNQSVIGNKLFGTFVKERIQTAEKSIWDVVKKRKLLTWKTTEKTVRVATKDKIIELKEDRCLFARMMVICKSRPEIDIKEAVGVYEFSVVPRSMFAADGNMLHCSAKSALMSILEKLPSNRSVEQAEPTDQLANADGEIKVSIVDGMAEVQALEKPDWIKTCSDLADHFTVTIFHKYRDADEVRVIFDRYDVPLSLKTATREFRQGGLEPISYKITDTTQISKVPMKRLLAHVSTKDELTQYLASKTLEKGRQNGLHVVVAWSSKCRATHKDMAYLDSDQEEADTKILLHAVDATASGAKSIKIFSPDTDVFVLALRRYPELCADTSFVTGRGQRHRNIQLRPIVRALGAARTAALPGFHAWSGADVTGNFAFKGKLQCWKAFLQADEDCVTALADLGSTIFPTAGMFYAIEKLVCQLYLPKTKISSLKDLRWLLFRRKQAESERLPPTQAALREAIKRAHYQAMIWANDKVANPDLPSPENYGWKKDKDKWIPVMTRLQPAPDAVLYLVKCGCGKDKCRNNRCSCRRASLTCTGLCSCSNDETGEECDNVDMIENDSCDDETSDEQDDDSEEDEDGE
ncbi:unnamed protein product [Porites lobata]|uniref:Tesmin/TSO1-like CXC domain-containing protein n=1 Tax=Porites lobata TaxID=104759 RepID=A0ABN8NAF7_9CNID|nr:unnamed protein product [Porites lobata]